MKTRDSDELRKLQELGRTLHAGGQHGRALEVCERILRLTPRDAYTHANRAMLLHQLQRDAEALAAADRAIKLMPQLAGAHYARALILLGLGRPEEALAVCDRVLRMQPGFAEAHNLRGQALRELGRGQDALEAYASAIGLKPDYAEALNNRGLILLARGEHARALEDFEQACAHNPSSTAAHYNRAMALGRLGRGEESVPALQRAIQCDPKALRAYHGLALALRNLGRAEGALQVSQAARRLAPDSAEAHCELALALWPLNRHDEALASLDRALALDPGLAVAHEKRGELLVELGRQEAGREALQSALQLNPESVTARYALATLGAGEVPAQSPRDYVVGLFDDYAERFDQHLVEQLEYRAPVQLYEAVARLRPAGKLAILDLGCGTGLCGDAFAGMAARLVGIDVSPLMLAKAGRRKLYTELRQGDICEVLESLDGAFDLMVAGDVFIYIGDLARVFALAAPRLSPAGLLAFSIESHAGDEDFRLQPTGRYSQSSAYIGRLAAAHALSVLDDQPVTLRRQAGAPVAGRVMVLGKSRNETVPGAGSR
jgi:predicted TPR repeat methyltransferase